MKPKINRAGNEKESKPFDRCQTPPDVAKTLQPFVKPQLNIWESAAGQDQLLVDGLQTYLNPLGIIPTDILQGYNFFEYQPKRWDIQITNPPYSVKFQWLKRSYELGKPFALLLPVETIGAKKAQELMKFYGAEIILLNRRVNFKMPNIGFEGSAAQFPVLWLTNGLNIGQQISYAEYAPIRETRKRAV